MGAFAKGDIVLFPFPYTDLTNRKLRPCLVLSSTMGEDIILCQITSKQARKDDYAIELKQEETLNGSLAIDSYIRANMLFTAATKQIRMKYCAIANEKYARVVEAIHRLIAK